MKPSLAQIMMKSLMEVQALTRLLVEAVMTFSSGALAALATLLKAVQVTKTRYNWWAVVISPVLPSPVLSDYLLRLAMATPQLALSNSTPFPHLTHCL